MQTKYHIFSCLILAICLAACRSTQATPPTPIVAIGKVTATPIAPATLEATPLSSQELPPDIQLNQPFSLTIGQEARLTEAGLSLKFQEVLEDSRCPSKVNCAWIGRAVLVLIAQKDNQPPVELTVSTIHSPEETDRVSFEGYEIQLKAIEPYPEYPDVPISPQAYRATLIVQRHD